MEAVSDSKERLSVEDWQEHLKTLVSEREALDAEFRGKRFDDEAKERWNAVCAEVDEVKATIAELELRAEQVAKSGDEELRTESGDSARTTRYGATALTKSWTHDIGEIRQSSRSHDDYLQRLRDNAMHVVEGQKFSNPTVNRERAQTHIANLLDTIDFENEETGKKGGELARRILVTGSKLYNRAFGKYVMGAPLDPEEQRALSTSGSAGGYALVYQLDPTLVPTSNYSVNPWRALARIETIAGTNEYKFVTSGSITASYAAEATENSDNAPTLAQPDIIVEKAQAFVPFSIEIGEDWGGLQAGMAMDLSDAKDDLEATKFATGAGHGSQEPKGVITAATNTTGTATTAAFVVGDVYKVFEALPARFRPRSQFVANLFVIDKIRQFDTSGGSGVWMGPMSFGLQGQSDAGAAGTIADSVGVPLLGRRVWESTAMGSALTTTTKILLVGDFRYFVIVDRIGMNVEVLPLVVGTAHRPTGQRGLYAYWRNSSDVLSASAFEVLVT